MKEVTLTFSPDEAVAVLKLLGSLPTEQGAYPLWARLSAEKDEQMKSNDSIPQVEL